MQFLKNYKFSFILLGGMLLGSIVGLILGTKAAVLTPIAAIPSNLIASKNIGIPEDIKNITIPMGCNLHKDGACLISILKIAFMCSIFKINFLDPKNLFTTGDTGIAMIISRIIEGKHWADKKIKNVAT